MMKWRNSLNELFEKEMFLIEECKFSIADINALCTTDFELYYQKQVEKLLTKKRQIEDAKNSRMIHYQG